MNRNLALLLVISGSVWSAPALAVDPVSFDEYKNTVSKIDWKKRVIPFDQFQQDCQKPGVIILDLRSEAEYKQGHIRGALLMGADIKEDKLKQLVPDKKTKIIVYCTNTFFPTRRISLNNVCLPQMIALGYPNVFVIEEIWQKDFEQVEKLKQSNLWQNNSVAK
jgi:hypothetical protein